MGLIAEEGGSYQHLSTNSQNKAGHFKQFVLNVMQISALILDPPTSLA